MWAGAPVTEQPQDFYLLFSHVAFYSILDLNITRPRGAEYVKGYKASLNISVYLTITEKTLTKMEQLVSENHAEKA